MSITGGAPITYANIISGVKEALLAKVGNVGSDYASSVPDVLKSGYTFQYRLPVQYGLSPLISMANDSTGVLSVVPTATFESDFDNFISNQLISLNINATEKVKTTLLVKVLTALYSFITTRIVLVYAPRRNHGNGDILAYEASAFFYTQVLSPGGIPATNIVNLSSIVIDSSDVSTIVTALWNQASSGVRSYPTTFGWTYEY